MTYKTGIFLLIYMKAKMLMNNLHGTAPCVKKIITEVGNKYMIFLILKPTRCTNFSNLFLE